MHFYYHSVGVYSDPTCPSDDNNHAVDLIGWGTDPATGKDYWILRNSWDESWGQKGYAWIERGTNMCGIESSLGYAVTKLTGNPLPTASPSKTTTTPASTDSTGSLTTFAGSG